MKWLSTAVVMMMIYSGMAYAIDKGRQAQPVVQVTGEGMTFFRVPVTSYTVTQIAPYNGGRAALTCTNEDANNTVYIGSSTVITSTGPTTMPLLKLNTITLRNSGALYGVLVAGVTISTVSCVSEF